MTVLGRRSKDWRELSDVPSQTGSRRKITIHSRRQIEQTIGMNVTWKKLRRELNSDVVVGSNM